MPINNISGVSYRPSVVFDTPLPPRAMTTDVLHQPLDKLFTQAQSELSDLDNSLQQYAQLSQQADQKAMRADVAKARNDVIKKVIAVVIALGGAIAAGAAAVATLGAATPAFVIALLNAAVALLDLGCSSKNYYNLTHEQAPLPGGGDSLENLCKVVLPALGIKEKHIQKISSLVSLLVRSSLLITSAGLGFTPTAFAMDTAKTVAQALGQLQAFQRPVMNLIGDLPGVASTGVAADAAASKKQAVAAGATALANLKADHDYHKDMHEKGYVSL